LMERLQFSAGQSESRNGEIFVLLCNVKQRDTVMLALTKIANLLLVAHGDDQFYFIKLTVIIASCWLRSSATAFIGTLGGRDRGACERDGGLLHRGRLLYDYSCQKASHAASGRCTPTKARLLEDSITKPSKAEARRHRRFIKRRLFREIRLPSRPVLRDGILRPKGLSLSTGGANRLAQIPIVPLAAEWSRICSTSTSGLFR
uniref:RYDR_ITPR domain-containing protein n=1 Tax=Macrostomum lignano TaxID=282301 RepID=A0A1I8F4B1_9PLAT